MNNRRLARRITAERTKRIIKCKPENVYKEINNLLEQEKKLVSDAIDIATIKVREVVTNKMKQIAPDDKKRKRKKDYKDDFYFRTDKQRLYTNTKIANKQYQLTHLLEDGHFVFNQHGGAYGRTKAQPHFIKGQDMADEMFINELINIIEKFGG